MKKNLLQSSLLIYKCVLLSTTFIATSCSSDSNDTEPVDTSIQADYVAKIGSTKDITINNNGEVKYIGMEETSDFYELSLKTVDIEGNVRKLTTLDFNTYYANNMGVAADDSGNILFVNDFNTSGKNINQYSPSSNSISSYTVKHLSSAPINNARMNVIRKFDNNSYIVFDYSTFSIRRYMPNLATDVQIVGSGTSGTTDGVGINGSFSGVSDIAVHDNSLAYVIDQWGKSLRKIELVNGQYKITTLVTSANEEYRDISTDDQGNLLVLLSNKGIFKFSKTSGALEPYLTGELKVSTKKPSDYGIKTNWESVSLFFVKNADIYVKYGESLIKISNYKAKLNVQ